MIYANGLKLLEESDRNINLNLVDGTSQKPQKIVIHKGTFYANENVYSWKFDYPITFSVCVINSSDRDINFRLNNGGPNDKESNVVKAHSSGLITCSNSASDGGYFQTSDRSISENDCNLQIYNLKVEKGLTATSWCPSASDLNLVTKSDALLAAINDGPDNYDLHSETRSKILIFSGNANTTRNKPSNFNEGFAILIRLASANSSQDYMNWGTAFFIDPRNNKIWMATDYGQNWSDWREI